MFNIPTIATVGEILVEFVSHKRNCAFEQIADYSGPYPSGAPAIFLDQAARIGAQTLMIGGVGNDGFGNIVTQRLKDDGVNIDGVNISRAQTTGVAFVSYYDSGERDFIFHFANTAVDDFSIPPHLIDPANTILHVSTSSLGAPSMRGKIMELVRKIVAAGGQITCDPNARPELMRDTATMDAMYEVMHSSYCLLPSTSDLQFLYPDLSEDAAIDRLLSAKAEIIAIKRGAQGASIVGNGKQYNFHGHTVAEIDPTGAGDCFCGTFVSLISQGVDLQRAGEIANAAGAIAVTRLGPMEGNSSHAEISQFLD